MKLSEQLVNELLYGEDKIVITDSLIEQYLNENSQVQGVYSDEGLYDFFANFADYKRVTAFKATQILGWPVVDYILSDEARSPRYDLSMMDDQKTGVNQKTRADMASYGGAIMMGSDKTKVVDAKYQEEMEQIASVVGWDIIKWMGVGDNRKSQVVIVPSYKLEKMKSRVNEDVAIGITKREDVIPSPSRKGVKKAASRKDKSIYIKEEENRIKDVIGIYPGRFQPFGPHHKRSYEFLKKRFKKVYIVTSNKTGGARHPMSFSEKKKHMMRMGIPGSDIKMESQPYIPKKLLSSFDKDTTAVVFGVGEKDGERLSSGKYFKPFRKNYSKLKGFEEHGYTLQLPHTSIKVGGLEISGTTMRKLLGSKKFETEQKKKFFKKLFGYFDDKTFEKFASSFMQENYTFGKDWMPTSLAQRKKMKRIHQKLNRSIRESDLYTDANPKNTIKGLKFATVKDAQASVNKIKSSGKPHAHKIQAAVAMEQRAKEMGKKGAAAIYRAYINKNKLKEQKELLLMGGAYGHMAHPFDDYGLTFGELKDIIDLGLQGKLDKEEAVTEKLDGQNIMISAINGKAVAARNKGDLKRGGMSLRGVKAKFKNHIPSVKNAFVFSMQDIASSVERMSKKDQEALFNNGKNWANIEIIYPENLNVIDYDGPATIVFHGILKYNEAWTPSGEVKSGGARLAAIINKVNGAIKTKFAFKGPNVITMHKVKDYTAMKGRYIGALSKLQSRYKLTDSNELSLWHQHFWLEYILNGANSSDYSNIPDNVLYPLMKRWAFSDKSYKMTEINKLKNDHPKFVEWVRATEKLDHAKMLKNNMKPFEEIFFGVGAEILANASNFLSANPDKTAQKLRSDLDKASKALLAKKDFSNLGKLKAQLQKLKAMPDISKAAPTEGLVFKYNGKVYKFTGFFAPINQILGLEKFSR